MNRGRAAARGSRRGAAVASSRAAGENNAGSSTSAVTDTPGSATPVPQSIATTSTRGGATTRVTRAPTAGRFRPKNIRRDEAERDSLARQEEQKASERAADERKARGRSRFRSKRSRGDAMGRGGFGRVISGASGPFSSGAAGKPYLRDTMTQLQLSNGYRLRRAWRQWLVRRWRRRWWWWFWGNRWKRIQIGFETWLCSSVTISRGPN